MSEFRTVALTYPAPYAFSVRFVLSVVVVVVVVVQKR